MQSQPALGATGFMSGLPTAVRDRLLARGHKQHFAKGQIIQQHGDHAHEFWYIESGSVQIGRFSEAGRLTLFARLGAGETFGELAFIGEFPRAVDAIAGSDSVLVRIGENELQNLLTDNPATARLLLRTMALTVQDAFNMIEASRNFSTVERTADALLRLCGDQQGEIIIAITQQELADLIGVSRVSLGKSLAELEKRGLIARAYGGIAISNKPGLAAIYNLFAG